MKLSTKLLFIALLFSNTLVYGYNYHADIDEFATVARAKKIMSEMGGVFIGPEDIGKIFGRSDFQLPYTLPFTVRQIIECIDSHGSCVIFPTIPTVGKRKKETTINKLIRNSSVKWRLDFVGYKRRPWFYEEEFARAGLTKEWHLISMNVESKGVPRDRVYLYKNIERIAEPNVYFWMLVLLPKTSMIGEAFYTATDTGKDGRNIVYMEKPEEGQVKIYYSSKKAGSRRIGILPEVIPIKK